MEKQNPSGRNCFEQVIEGDFQPNSVFGEDGAGACQGRAVAPCGSRPMMA
jgi:hypothetical protein